MAQDNDKGIKSRKLWFSVFTSILIFIAAKTVPGAVYPEAVMGFISVLTIFSGANTFTKWISSSHMLKSKMLPGGTPEEPEKAKDKPKDPKPKVDTK